MVLGLGGVPHEEIAYGGEPAGIIGGCVSAISGDYVVREVDWVVQGHEPIVIERRHLSSDAGGKKWSGWEFFFNHLVASFYVVEESTDYTDREKPAYETCQLDIPEKFGFSLGYEGSYLRDNPRGQLKLKGEYPHALTNCHTGEIGARYSAFNNHVCFDPNESRVVKVYGTDGTVRAYQCLSGYGGDYYLRWERLPNGNKVHYQWHMVDREWRLRRVATTDWDVQETYAWMEIDYVMHGVWLDRIEIITSDAQKIVYDIANKKGIRSTFWSLERVENSGRPGQKYEYWGNKKRGYYVSDRLLPEGRRLRIDYYLKGENPLSRGNVVIKRKKDKKVMRVKRLRLPLLKDAGLQSIYEFYYHPGSYRRKGGYTDVVDPYGNPTRYTYNKDFLLTGVNHQEKGKGTFVNEEYEWTEYSPLRGHWLKGKKLRDHTGSVLREIQYKYDQKGNVEKEILIGDLTGGGNGGERYVVERVYNEANLVTLERFPKGKSIEYTYFPNTSLILQKLILDHGVIKIRNIYVYEKTVLIQKIIDDGSTQNPHDLNGVTQRLIMNIRPRKEGELIGYPDEIEEKYLDLNSGDEVLLGRQKLEYYSFGKPRSIAHFDSDGKRRYVIEFSYDGRGRVVKETDPMGRVKRVNYDENDNLVLDDNPDRELEVLKEFDIANRLSWKKEGNRTDHFEYDYLGREISNSDFRDIVTRYAYDLFGHPVRTQLPAVENQLGEVKNPFVNRIYNALGEVAKEVDPEGNETQTFYTCRGKPSRIVHPDGNEEHFRYDLEGELWVYIKPGGTRTVYERDFLNRVVKKSVFSKEEELLSEEKNIYDSFHLLKTISPDGVETVYEYDGAGRKCLERTLDRLKTIHYDSLGREAKIIEGEMRVLVKMYDLLDRVIEEKEEDLEGKIFSTVRYEYDDYSNQVAMTKVVQIGDAIERIDYDPYKREVLRTDPLGYQTKTEYDDYFVNVLSQKVLKKTITNPNGTQTVEEFDALNRLVKLEKLSPDGAFLLSEDYFYDFNGNKWRQESTLNTGKKVVKAWEYDQLGRISKLIEGVGTPLEKTTAYTYTADGEKKEVIKPDGVVINYSYDGLGRQKSIWTSDGSCHYSLKYDEMGNVIESLDLVHDQKTTRRYNHFGNLVHETFPNGLKLDQDYDHLGRRIGLTLLDGSTVKYDYDSYHLLSVARRDYEHRYNAYDQSHNLLHETLIRGGGDITFQIDLCGRRIQSESNYSLEQIPSIDPNGNVKEYFWVRDSKEEHSTFEYDFLDQLTLETGPFEKNYSYDSHHNRLHKNDSEYRNDSLHQLVATSEAIYDYDLNGNRILWQMGDHQIIYTYDGLDRLIQIRSGEKAISFSYDSWGCVEKIPRKNLLKIS